jgi:oligoendopeptidase F
MHRTIVFIQLLIIISFFSVNSQTLDRKDIPEKYKWNLKDVYKSVDEWAADLNKVTSQIDDVAKYKGRLAESAQTFYDALNSYFNLQKEFAKLYDYASKLSDENLNIAANQALKQQASNLGTKISEETAFINPEILKIDSAKIKEFFNEKKDLDQFSMFVNNILRLKEHTLSADGEKLLASFGLVAGTPGEVYSIFNNAEMPNAKVKLSTGEEVELTSSAFTKYRSVENREDREKVFKSFFENYGRFKNTYGTNLGGKEKIDFVYAKDRNYKSSLEAALAPNNIPTSVYENLVAQIHKSIPTLKRFLQLKKKILGLDTLHYYDLYTPLVKQVNMNFTIEEGQKIILDALKPLGENYLSVLQKAFNERWIDYMPNTGKKGGAYSSGSTYDFHPYILINWNNDYLSLSTLVHELGHTMHSYFSNKYQPYAKSDYPIFVAEIASTLNENLLNNYMVQHAKSKDEKLYLLGSYLELLRTTVFRQTLFAEFELEAHKMAENDEPITGEALTNLYYKLVKEYYGDDESSCVVDPYIAYEWEYIPHFYYNFYVYQYSTSLIYSTAIAEKLITEGKPAVDNYYKLLKGGNSEHPIDLIKKAGIDPLSSEPFELTMNKMNKIMDQIEKIVK